MRLTQEANLKPAEHFSDLDQQHNAASLGMWAFLATEILFFGGMFTGYTVYRVMYPEVFAEASSHLYMWIGAVNTAVLLLSSLCVALAVHHTKHDEKSKVNYLIIATVALAGLFCILKAIEYYLDVHDQIVPGYNFASEHFNDPLLAQLFFVIYFFMTGLHAFHVLIGIGVFIFILYALSKTEHVVEMSNFIEMTGLYWHFVDIVWIFLFPLLYLIGA